MNVRAVVAGLLAAALAFVFIAGSVPARADSASSNYIYVYPNSAVRVLVNGTAQLKHGLPEGNTSVAVTFYENYTVLTAHHEGKLKLEAPMGPQDEQGDWQDEGFPSWGSGQPLLQWQPPSLTGAVTSWGYFNRTSNGRVEVGQLVSYNVYQNDSQTGSLNVTAYESIEVVTEPAEYLVTLGLNASWYPGLESTLGTFEGELSVVGLELNGVQVKEYKASMNSTYLSVFAVLIVNGTPAPINTTLGKVQAALNAALTPGFVNGKYYVLANLSSHYVNCSATVNASNSLINDAVSVIGALSQVSPSDLRSLLSGAMTSGLGMHEEGLFEVKHHEFKKLRELINASEGIVSYVEENFRVVVPSTMYVNVSVHGHEVKYALESAMFEKAGAKNPKQTLSAITYLVGNASQILSENNLTDLADAVRSLDNVQVNLIGVDGVVVKPSVTTIGNLTSVTVTVPSGSAAASVATVGGVSAAVAVVAALVFLAKRH
ncbi:MAG: hypothetical protein ACP5HK_04975 [Acidilobus sp.]